MRKENRGVIAEEAVGLEVVRAGNTVSMPA